jgi:hypothetical protein
MINNPIDDYFLSRKNENIKLILSVKKLSKLLNFKIRKVVYYCNNSTKLRKIDPMEIGSLKYTMGCFTLI